MAKENLDYLYQSYAKWKETDLKNPTQINSYFEKEFSEYMHFKDTYNVLDFGCGSGDFLLWCKSKFCNCIGIELNDHTASIARGKGCTVYTNIDAVDDNSIDLITAIDVIEHLSISESVSLIKTFSLKLKANGILFIRVPNSASPLGLASQFGDLTHVTAYTNLSLQQLMIASDMTTIECRGMKGSSKGLAKLVRKYLIKILNWIANKFSSSKFLIDSNIVIVSKSK